jgi:hypothetical protein
VCNFYLLVSLLPSLQLAKALYVLQVLCAYVVAVFLCCVAVAFFYINEDVAVAVQQGKIMKTPYGIRGEVMFPLICTLKSQ